MSKKKVKKEHVSVRDAYYYNWSLKYSDRNGSMAKTMSQESKYIQVKRQSEKNLCSEQTAWGLLNHYFQQTQTKTLLNTWSVCERPVCTLHNHEHEHLVDSLMHDRPIKKDYAC